MTNDQLFGSLSAAIEGTPLNARWGQGQVLDYLKHLITSLLDEFDIGSLTDERKAEILAVVKKFYDTVIRPIDLPYIPNGFIENNVDDFIWLGVQFTVKRTLGM